MSQDAREQSAARPWEEVQHQQQSAADASAASAAHGSVQQQQWAATPVGDFVAGADHRRIVHVESDPGSERVDPANARERSASRRSRLDELDDDGNVDDDDDVVFGTPPLW